MNNHRALRILTIVLVILLIPFFGNIFVEGWNWGVFDFIIAGALLFATGAMIDCAIRKITSPLYRTLTVVSIVLAFILLWVELAVDAVSRLLSSLF